MKRWYSPSCTHPSCWAAPHSTNNWVSPLSRQRAQNSTNYNRVSRQRAPNSAKYNRVSRQRVLNSTNNWVMRQQAHSSTNYNRVSRQGAYISAKEAGSKSKIAIGVISKLDNNTIELKRASLCFFGRL